MYDDHAWGSCSAIETASPMGRVTAICEGCVDVAARVDDMEFVTHKNFGCVKYTERRSAN